MRPRSRSVIFDVRREVFHIDHLSDLPDDVVSSLWMFGPDFDANQQDMIRSVRAMRRGQIDDSPSNPNPLATSRGLEHLLSPAHLEQRKINKDCVSQAVLGEQGRQRAAGNVRDDEGLRSASERASLWSRDLARTVAAEDSTWVEVQRRTARAALLTAMAAATASSSGNAHKRAPQHASLAENPSSKRCFSVLQDALVLSENAVAAGSTGPGGNLPSAVYETRTFQTEVTSVGIRPPGSSAGAGSGSSSNAAAHAKPAGTFNSGTVTAGAPAVEGNGFFSSLRGLKNETLPVSPRVQQGQP